MEWSRLKLTMRPLPPALLQPILEVRTGVHSCDSLGLMTSCVQSDVRGNEYLRWAGRDLYRSGIIGYNEIYQIKAPCFVREENPIKSQNPYNPTKTLTDPTTNLAGSADRSTPSYILLLNQETCYYDFSFSAKHDATLPNAGGWDASLPNGVTREEFDAVCDRGTNVIADDASAACSTSRSVKTSRPLPVYLTTSPLTTIRVATTTRSSLAGPTTISTSTSSKSNTETS
jgi:hypothetical protein